ncbi:cytochrome c biogenesis protein CcsA [Oscillochloris sp. ZM17-4]|uniref:heme lyase CcmF/NrfE family subunit n=1 Tax=Oscillochloris sp. ZM17-4 TaxID=2866714 RepID=UPI001C72DB30|nr:cytochrome c biogenesis protein CcsA [Oscillochloris sp. ZM17-4]MBX0327074.1 cytochrome c biogenesis protein CcsA [Oscillochloris sp. ZM17-4]
MYPLGTFLIVTSIAMALLAIVSYVLVVRGNRLALLYARFGVFGSLGALLMAWTLLLTLFLAHRFDIDYVYNYSSRDLEFFFVVAASWAGQPGSFLIWTIWGGIAAALLVRRTKHFEPYVLLVMMLVQTALLLFVLSLNPFKPLLDAATGLPAALPADGKGLNPLLHNFWMIIHPPILFVGYALTTVPFAFAISALVRRDYDTWVARALPWTIAAWAFLGFALLLGGYWAYETLGWGGYWGWDPVENSSLVPWLILTALIHGMVLQRSHGGMRKANLFLALLGYILVFYATFLTRSGVYANFSVHSFVAEGIFNSLVGFLVFLIAVAMTLFVMRWRDIPARPLSDKFFSRDSFFVLMMISFVVTALVVGVGTSMPVISAIPGLGHTLQSWMSSAFEVDDGTLMNPQAQPFTDGRFSLAASFYKRTVPPLGAVIIMLMIVGPLLGWRDANMRHLLRALRWPAIAAVIAAIIAMLINVRDVLALAYVAGGTFAIGTNLVMIIRTLRGGWMRIGGYLAHLGFSLTMIGMVGSSAYATPEQRLVMAPGETTKIYGYDFTFNGYQLDDQQRGVLDFTVTDGRNDTFSARPYLYYNDRMGATMQTPSIHSLLYQDVYISPAGYDPEVNPARPILGAGSTTTMGPYELTFVDFNLDTAAMTGGGQIKVGAKITVLYNGETSEVEPVIQVATDPATGEQKLEHLAATLPGGQTLTLVEVDPTNRMVLLEGKGDGIDSLPAVPAKGVITVSVKPLVIFVWTGVVIGVIGGVIALLRRYLEGQAALAGERVRLPKGLFGGLARRRGLQSPRPTSGD